MNLAQSSASVKWPHCLLVQASGAFRDAMGISVACDFPPQFRFAQVKLQIKPLPPRERFRTSARLGKSPPSEHPTR